MTGDLKLISDLRSVAHELADAARAAILPYFRAQGLHIENKLAGDYDPVTVADKAAEQAMRDILMRRRPQDAVLGEEYGEKSGESGLTWVLDPIDGTRGFVSGTPTWGVLIAISDASGPFYGLIDQPYIGERFEGGPDIATMAGPAGTRRLKAKTSGALSDAILFTTFPEVGAPQDRAGFDAVAEHVKLVRFGMDCYAYALLASGQIDLVIEASLQPYDIQAPIALVQASGGIVTDWKGNAAHYGGRALAAANQGVHQQALEILKDY